MDRAQQPYVGLFGSHSGDWRELCKQQLDAAGISWLDPADPRWQGIDAGNGDAQQALIDELVAEQHRGMLGAACVLYHLDARNRYHLAREPLPEDADAPGEALAARCELGFLTGRGIPTFAHVERDVRGRNYLWAQMKPHPHVVRCDTLDEAIVRAIAFVRSVAG